MRREILHNTYDYTKKFNINSGKPLTTKEKEVTSRPSSGEYTIKETDIKADANTLQVLGNNSEVLMNMEGGSRIISRTHTKNLIKLAKAGDSKTDRKRLGKYMIKVINTQDTQENQYV